MDHYVFIITKNDLKIIVAGIVIGGIFQIVCCEYLKRHAEFSNRPNLEEPEEVKPDIEPKSTKPKNKFRRLVPRFPRGGALIETELVVAIIGLIAEKGWLLGGAGTIAGLSLTKASSTAVSRVLRNAVAVNHSDYEKTRYFLPLPEEHKISLEQCEDSFKYLFELLKTKDIPYSEKAEQSFKILTTYLSLDTRLGRIRFVLCIVSIFYLLLSSNEIANFHILMQNLLKAIKSGQISKRLGRLIVRRLLKKNMPVDPELIDAVRG